MSATLKLVVMEKGKVIPGWTIETDDKVSPQKLLEYAKETLIEVAVETLKEELDKGFDPKFNTIVDNNARKNIVNVNPFGKIEFVARQDMDDILKFIYKRILANSPVLTGKYSNANLIFYNDVEVASSLAELETWLASGPDFQSKDQIRFVNITPYARKLERYGVTKNKTKEVIRKRHDKRLQGPVRIPNGVYALTASSANRIYGKNAFIRFSLLPGERIGLLASDNPTARNRNYQTKRNHIKSRIHKPYLYPCVVVNVIGSAITNGDTSE